MFKAKFSLRVIAGVILFLLWHTFTFAVENDDYITQAELDALNQPFTGDFNEMVKKRIIRVLIPYSLPFYFFDGARPAGTSYEAIQKFEKDLNSKLKTKHLKVHLIIIPTARENLFRYLVNGKGDIAMGNLTITEERQKTVDFCDPFYSGVDEILLTDKSHNEIQSVQDLSGKEVHVRISSSYYGSLRKLNEAFRAAKKKEVKIVPADENLDDKDLVEMVNAGLIPRIVIDSHKATFWAKVFDNIKLYPDIKLRTGGEIAWAIRKNSPQLKKEINTFVKANRVGTKFGNIIVNKYFKTTSYINGSVYSEHLKRFRETIPYFQKYAKEYGFDYLMLSAMGYQESKLDQKLKSPAGAIGVMQILPSTANDKNVNIPNITKIDPNIHAGAKYLRFMTDTYFADVPEMDKLNRMLFAFASYNAGPAKIAKLRQKAEKMGFDPNIWFNNVEVVAAKEIGRETVQYVSNIFKYYVAYRSISEKMNLEESVKKPVKSKKK